MTIYLNDTNNRDQSFKNLGYLHQRINVLVANGSQSSVPDEFIGICEQLGHAADRVQQIWNLCFNIHEQELKGQALNSFDLSGVYFLENKQREKIAVFKIGSRRAATEILASEVAHRIGLGDHFINGTFCVLEKPPTSLAPLLVQLWNSNFAEYTLNPKLIVGIIEEFASDETSNEREQEAFLKMVTLALSIGLRDAKKDGITKGSFRIFDADQCFPRRLDPIFGQTPDSSAARELSVQPAATDLQFLADYEELANKPIPQDLVKTMREIANSWDFNDIEQFLKNQPIRFADEMAEAGKNKDDTTAKMTIIDDPDELIELSDKINILSGFNNKKPIFKDLEFKSKDNMLTPDQINATIMRMTRIQKFFNDIGPESTCIDLVKAVDPYWGKLIETSFELKPAESKTPDSSKADKEIANINKQSVTWGRNKIGNAGTVSPYSFDKKNTHFVPKAEAMRRTLSGSKTPSETGNRSSSPSEINLNSPLITPTNLLLPSQIINNKT